MKAIETTATIKNSKQLILDTALHLREKSKVKLIILLPEEEDLNESEWLRAASNNPVFGFLKDSAEDIYTDSDGKPFTYEE